MSEGAAASAHGCRSTAARARFINSAPFAFRLARRTTGQTQASYETEGSRAELERNPVFLKAFTRAKERVRRMDIRFVEENDPLRQALLEIYAAVALCTPYNDFETH
jgi:hypothetical protein